jgi:hypothetical protein
MQPYRSLLKAGDTCWNYICQRILAGSTTLRGFR